MGRPGFMRHRIAGASRIFAAGYAALLALPVLAAEPSPSPAGTLYVTGGEVVDRQGAPVVGARITLVPIRSGQAVGEPIRYAPLADPADLPGTRSGADGRFTLRAPAGAYGFLVRAAGFAPSSIERVDLGGSSSAEVGRVRMDPEGTVEGRVVDDEGRPVAGVDVDIDPVWFEQVAEWRFPHFGDPSPVPTGTDGRFRVGELWRGRTYEARAKKDGMFARGHFVSVPSPAGPATITMHAATRLRGVVVDREGEPVRGARVEAWPVDWTRRKPGTSTTVPSVATDDRGRFELPGVPAGVLRVTVRATGHGETVREGLDARAGTEPAPLRLVVGDGTTLAVRVVDSEGRPVPAATVRAARVGARIAADAPPDRAARGMTDRRGQVRLAVPDPGVHLVSVRHQDYLAAERTVPIDAGGDRIDVVLERGLTLHGRVVDGRGRPVDNARVKASARGADLGGTATSDAEGRFVLRGRLPGVYALEVMKEGFAARRHGGFLLADRDVDVGDLSLDPGVSIHGRLRGFADGDLKRLRIAAEWQDKDTRSSADDPAVVDWSSATYRLDRVVPGTWAVVARIGLDVHARGRVVVGDQGHDAELDLVAGSGRVLEGVVTLEGEPVSGASVGLIDHEIGSQHVRQTGADGRFRFAGLPEGTLTYEVRLADGRRHVARKILLDRDRSVRVDLVDTVVVGRVVDQDGVAQPGARLSLGLPTQDGRSALQASATSDATGRFVLRALEPGPFVLDVEHTGFAPLRTTVDGGSDLGEVVLEALESFDLALRVDAVVPPLWVTYGLATPAGTVVRRGRAVLESGLAPIGPVAAGTWRVFVHAPGFAWTDTVVTVPGPVPEVTLADEARLLVVIPDLVAMEREATLVIRTADDAVLLPSHRWSVGGGLPVSERSFRNGVIALDALPPGEWRVEVVAGARRWQAAVIGLAGNVSRLTLD